MAVTGQVDFISALAVFWAGQEAPCFAVSFEAGHAATAGGKDLDCSDVLEEVDGKHVPDVVGDNVSDDEVDVARSVTASPDIATGVEGVSVDGAGVGGLDLDAPGAGSVVEDEVVAIPFAPGFGDGEAECGGFEEERGFGDLSAALGGEAGLARCSHLG